MWVLNATITPTTTGTFTIPTPGKAVEVEVYISQKGSDGFANLSIGHATEDWATVHSIFHDNQGGLTYKNSLATSNLAHEIAAPHDRINGVKTKSSSARMVAFNNTDIQFEVTSFVSQYQYNLIIRGN